MSEAELRHSYNGTRILIEASRILAPTFPAMGIYLLPEQTEMLRNVAHYLNRRSTFVGEYHGTYYNVPGDEDWDTILAIVADLEDKLMSTENTPFGYRESWVGSLEILAGSAGTQVVQLDPVESGELLVLESASWYNNTGQRGRMRLEVKTGVATILIAQDAAPAAKHGVLWSGAITLKEGDKITARQFSCLEDDWHIGAARGYKMTVPV